jgi:phosphoribosylformylglycinamidine synthase PurS subunit
MVKSKSFGGFMKGRIYVFLKEEVLDPQGKAIESALSTLGFKEVKKVRACKYFDIEIDDKDLPDPEKRLEEYAKKLLANEVIENFKVEILKTRDSK